MEFLNLTFVFRAHLNVDFLFLFGFWKNFGISFVDSWAFLSQQSYSINPVELYMQKSTRHERINEKLAICKYSNKNNTEEKLLNSVAQENQKQNVFYVTVSTTFHRTCEKNKHEIHKQMKEKKTTTTIRNFPCIWLNWNSSTGRSWKKWKKLEKLFEVK